MSLPERDWAEYIRLGMDYGTGFLKLAVQCIYPGREETTEDIFDVQLEDFNDEGSVEIEQVGVWVETTK